MVKFFPILMFMCATNLVYAATPLDEKLQEAENLLSTYSGGRQSLEKAGQLVSEAINEAPNSSNAYVLAGELIMAGGHLVGNNYQQGTFENALEMYRKAIELDKQNAEAYMLTARIQIRKKQFPEALKSLETAKKLNPKLTWLISTFGMYYQGIRDFSKAKQMYSKVKNRGPGKTPSEQVCYFDALQSLASFATFENDKKSLRILASEVEKTTLPQKAWGLGNMADFFFLVAMFDEGIEYARKALVIMDYGAARKALAKNLYGKACKQIRDNQPAAQYIDEAKSLGYDAFSLVSEFASASDELNSLAPYMGKIYNLRIDEKGVGHKQYR